MRRKLNGHMHEYIHSTRVIKRNEPEISKDKVGVIEIHGCGGQNFTTSNWTPLIKSVRTHRKRRRILG